MLFQMMILSKCIDIVQETTTWNEAFKFAIYGNPEECCFGLFSFSTVPRCLLNNAENTGNPGNVFLNWHPVAPPRDIFRKDAFLSRHRDTSRLISIFKLCHQTCDFWVVVIYVYAYCYSYWIVLQNMALCAIFVWTRRKKTRLSYIISSTKALQIRTTKPCVDVVTRTYDNCVNVSIIIIVNSVASNI